VTGTTQYVIEVCHETEGRTSATVVIEMKRASTHDLARLLGTAVGTGNVCVVVDLGERKDATSELLTVLHRTARHLRRLGGRLAVVTAQPELRRLFDVTLLSQAFGVFPTQADVTQEWG
jgi:anti-anti-sigma regulatory factor